MTPQQGKKGVGSEVKGAKVYPMVTVAGGPESQGAEGDEQ